MKRIKADVEFSRSLNFNITLISVKPEEITKLYNKILKFQYNPYFGETILSQFKNISVIANFNITLISVKLKIRL